MPFLSSLFHKKIHNASKGQPVAYQVTPPLPRPTPSTYAPGTGPAAHAQISQVNNIGLLSGVVIGATVTKNPVMGMAEGQVVGDMIVQRVQQGKKHQFYKEQALNHREGLPVEKVTGSRKRSERMERRDEKRAKRWEGRKDRGSEDGNNGEVVDKAVV